jgi:DnaJ-class molecular chaperone
MAKRDYYDVLGVAKTAAADEIRRAHRKLVRQYHPDVTKNDKKLEGKFKEVQEAYDVLSDETKRKNYDQFGHAGVDAGPAGAGGGDPFEQFRRAQQGGGPRGRGGARWQAGPNVSVEDFDLGDGGAGGFGDIFEQFFGAQRAGGAAGGRAPGQNPRGRAKPPTQRGEDIEYPVTLTFAQAARGMTLPLQINRDGKLETIDVKIPAGVKEGSRVRIKSRGQQVIGGEAGDLFIVTKVLAHPYYRREGVDIHVDLPISLYEAMLGTKVEVPTLDGPVTLTIPPGTSSGGKLRIKGRGFERGNEKGDQIVILKVMVPKQLDEEGRELVKGLEAKYPLNPRADIKW